MGGGIHLRAAARRRFASGLAGLRLPHADIPVAPLLFNVGVEAGQLAFVLLVLAMERAFRELEMR
jgi:hypothetical protein